MASKSNIRNNIRNGARKAIIFQYQNFNIKISPKSIQADFQELSINQSINFFLEDRGRLLREKSRANRRHVQTTGHVQTRSRFPTKQNKTKQRNGRVHFKLRLGKHSNLETKTMEPDFTRAQDNKEII